MTVLLSREKVSRAIEVLATLQHGAEILVEESAKRLAETVLATREVVEMFRRLVGMLGPRNIVFEPPIMVTLPHLVYDSNDQLVIEQETVELSEIIDHSDEYEIIFLLMHQEKDRPLTCCEVTENSTKFAIKKVLLNGNPAKIEAILRDDLERNGMKLSCDLRNYFAFVLFVVENVDALERGFRRVLARARESIDMLAIKAEHSEHSKTRLEALLEEVRGR